MYDQGIQKLDTTRLPLGSYNVEIEIVDPGGKTRTETRFVVKRSELPLNDQPYLWFDFGALEETPERKTTIQRFEKEFIARAGTFRKISDFYGVGGNIILNSDVSVAEGFTEYFRKNWRTRAGFAGTTKKDYVYDFFYLFDKEPWISNFSWRQSFYNSDEYKSDKIYLYKPITSTSKQLTFDIKWLFLKGTGDIGLFSSYSKRLDKENYSYGPKLRFNIFKKIRGLTGTLELSAFQTDLEQQFFVNLLFNYNKGRWQVFNSTRYDYRENDDSGSANYKNTNETWNTDTSLTWQDGDLLEDDLRLVARYNKNDGLVTTETKMDFKSNYGRITGSTRNNRNNNDKTITFDTNVAYSEGKIAYGGKNVRKSMVVVQIEGDNKTSSYDIYINSVKKQKIKVGKTKVIPLIAFREYFIYLKPRDGNTTHIDLKPKKVVLYPGTMVYLKYEAKNMGVLLSTLYDKYGRPMKNTEIRGEMGSTITDETGYFQMDVLLGEELEINGKYKYTVPNTIDENGLLMIDEIKIRGVKLLRKKIEEELQYSALEGEYDDISSSEEESEDISSLPIEKNKKSDWSKRILFFDEIVDFLKFFFPHHLSKEK